MTQLNAASADEIGAYPVEVSNHPTKERSLSRALRAMTFATVVLACTNAASLWLLAAVFPLQKVQPFLVTFSDKAQQVVKIEPAEMTASSYNVMTESEVRDYVASRHTIPATQAAVNVAWGPRSRLALRMAPDAYRTFVEANTADLKAVRDQGYTRSIEIAAVSRLAQDTWQVEFQSVDTPSMGSLGAPSLMSAGPSMTEVRQTWLATMRVSYVPERVRYDDKLLNPLGFTVLEYFVTKKAGL